ncbi:class I SAM-dependent methyltransferase [Patescibacteria group bacterium]|nr:class I SAM-dependent methyltransferase [Patescibacteria group bacterium]
MVKNQWDRYAYIYERGIGQGGDTLHDNLIDPLIFKYLGNKKYQTIVDAGCGNGYLLKRLSGLADLVIGLDYSIKLLETAKRKISGNRKIKLIQTDLTKQLPLEKASVDVIIANMSLQYLPSLKVFAEECQRTLKKNGLLIVTVDHPGHFLFSRAQELAGKKDPHFIEADSYFSERKFKKNSLWGQAVLEYYHRPLKSYLNVFSRYLRLIEVDENSQDGETPRILGLLFEKNG